MSEAMVKEYYASCVKEEWRRLAIDAYHKLEYETSLHFLIKHLPKKGLVLDAGGGPGRYTVELAKRGYKVVLLDLVSENIQFAKGQITRNKLQGNVVSMQQGSIIDLACYGHNTFDAVLCLGGALSHVVDKNDRKKAISELTRVAKGNAPIIASVIGKLGAIVAILWNSQNEIEMPHFQLFRKTGDYHGGHGFTACHLYLAEELAKDFKGQKLTQIEMVGLQGIGSHQNDRINELAKDRKLWRHWLSTHLETCTNPAVVGISEHIMIICKKKKNA